MHIDPWALDFLAVCLGLSFLFSAGKMITVDYSKTINKEEPKSATVQG